MAALALIRPLGSSTIRCCHTHAGPVSTADISRDSQCRGRTHLEEVEAVGAQVGAELPHADRRPGGEVGVPVLELRHAGPAVLVGRAQRPARTQHTALRGDPVAGEAGAWCGVVYRKILKIWSISESPANMAFLVSISTKMVPHAHTSTGGAYACAPSRISGGRYHSVTTCVAAAQP
jgi:hypothetical protein